MVVNYRWLDIFAQYKEELSNWNSEERRFLYEMNPLSRTYANSGSMTNIKQYFGQNSSIRKRIALNNLFSPSFQN